jgi:hypothetical protein
VSKHTQLIKDQTNETLVSIDSQKLDKTKMTSHLSLSTTIDYLVERIDKVKVFQDHLKLIITSLIRLQHGLNESNAMNTVTHLQQDIEQTFVAIDIVVASCSENEVNLNGVTYRDLESLLLRIQIRLAQHEADLTNDYQRKIQILSRAYHEQQILLKKVFDEKMKQRLETIEQNTKENNIEQLRLLREKHFDTIKVYLENCTELHKSVPLTGLTIDIIAKFAHTFYQISSEDQIQLESKWQSCDLPLTRTFIQFKPDKSTSYERNESRRLLMEPEAHMLQGAHSKREVTKGIWERLVSTPYMMSMIERDRYEQEEDVSEENIIRTKRWIVILGDPGSGKTSFARWLVRHLAQTLLLNGQHSTDYGPLRIPILIRIGEFAEMLKEQPSLTLFDYIGKHKWMGKSIVDDPSISLDDLSGALQDYIRYGQAMIILDGLDEIPVSDQRSLIINIVENFVDTYVQTPTGASAFDDRHLTRLLDNPSKSGGNQLIVTSRIVGYHSAPLAGQFAHYTIRPMDMEHMKDFVDYWFFRVHQRILDTLGLSIPNQGENHGEALKKELDKTGNIGLLDVASNSCLMSFVCSVAFNQIEGSPLPAQRILLYEAIVNSMLTLWSSKRSTIPIPELIRIFSDIATYIHGNSASGLIHEEKMKEICIQSIKDSSNKPLSMERNIRDVESQACEFVRIIREDVGILAARGESLCGFLHLTFQEYFTCLKLIDTDNFKQEKLVAQSLHRHANDPRFRVPIALALGKISLSWSEKDFNRFCLEFIQEQDVSNSRLPLGAYMIISFSNDFVNYPSDDVLFNALDCLMVSAGQHKWSVGCPFLVDQITDALRKLRHNIVSLWINNFLSRSPPHDIQTISALCHLLEGKPHQFENIKWLNQSSCLMLQYLSSLDNETNEFAIDRLLVKITFSNHRLLPVNTSTFKEFLITHEIELKSIPVVLFPLIITLYGGLKRNGETTVFDPFHIYRESTAVTPILIRFLSKLTCNRQDQNIIILKDECLRILLARKHNQDESPETVDVCIATICLYGIDYVRENAKIISESLIRMSMNRLKYISMILRQFYFIGNRTDDSIENETTKFISSVIEKFQYDESSKVQFLNLLNSLRTSSVRLQSSTKSIFFDKRSNFKDRLTMYLPNSLRKEENFLNHLLFTDIQFYPDQKSCSLIQYFTKLFWILEHNDEYDTQNRMIVAMDKIPEYLLFHNDEDLLFPLTFIPTHLQNLYLQLLKQGFIMVHPEDSTVNGEHLFFGHILLECLMLISNTSWSRCSIVAASITLLPWLRMHQLENFGSSLLWISATKDSYYLSQFENTRQLPMNYETGRYVYRAEYFRVGKDITDQERRTLIEKCVAEEYQRLRDASAENDGRSMKMYSACISLARTCRWSHDNNRLHLLEECIQGAMSINNKLVRLDALCVIAFYSHSDYNQIYVNQGRSLQKEIDYQLHDVYPNLPLLLHATIFIRCLPLIRHQETIDKCLQNLFNKFNNAEQKDQKVVFEALSPYLKSMFDFSSVLETRSNILPDYNKTIHSKSSVLKEYFTDNADENLSNSLLITSLYLVELASDLQKSVAADDLHLIISHSNLSLIDNVIASTLFAFEGPILTTAHVFAINNILSFGFLTNRSTDSEKLYSVLNNTLHRFNLVEFKACRLLEHWIRWKDSNELSLFTYHAALLLTNSDFWSVEAAIIVCDLLCYENDRFRQRAEMIYREKKDENDIRASSKLGLDVLLTLLKKKVHYEYTSPSATLTLIRVFENITVDVPSHLETLLWLERYRIYALANREYVLSNSRSTPISHVASYFPNDITINVSYCETIGSVSTDLIQYICTLILSNFSSFLEIDGDKISDAVLESHSQFVVSVLVHLVSLIRYTDDTRHLTIDTLTTLMEISKIDEICQATVYALGYVCNKETSQILFDKLQIMVNNETNEPANYSEGVLAQLISSYCHCAALCDFNFDQDAMNLFRKLLKHPSQNVLKAVHVGLGRVLKNSSLLFEMLDSDYIQCYHALIGSTAYMFTYDVRQSSTEGVAEFIEQHPDLLSIFVVELYNSIRHFTDIVQYVRTMDFHLAYGYPQHVEVASSIVVRMPAAFCAFIKDWCDGDNLKRALFYTSKQHNYRQRAACLTILSVFGELTVELCEMIIEALRDDPHIQNTCYKCLTRINSIKDEMVVLNLLFSYLKSKSMNVRYAAVKMLLHLSQSSFISSDQVQTVFNNLMLDPDSNEDLWLIEEQDDVRAKSIYYNAGPLKDVVYSLLVRYLTGDSSTAIRRNELNDIDADFAKSEKAARLASCLYEREQENLSWERSSTHFSWWSNDDSN